MKLDFEFFLAVFGTVVSVYLGILGIRYTLKYINRTQLIFTTNSCISLFKAVVKNLDEIEIKFKGKKIDENLIIFKGTIFNTGNTDIDQSIVHQPVTLTLPSNYHWIQSSILDKSEGLNVEYKIVGADLIFEWDLLKEKEYFTFDSLIEYKAEKNEDKNLEELSDISRRLTSDLKLSHRISHLKTIQKKNLPSKPMSLAGQIFLSLYLLAFILWGLYMSVGQYLLPSFNVVYESHSGEKIQNVTYEPISLLEVQITSDDEEFSQKVPINEFQKTFKDDVVVHIEKSPIVYWQLIVGGIMSLAFGFFLFIMNRQLVKDRNLYRQLKIIADKYDDLPEDEDRRNRPSLLASF